MDILRQQGKLTDRLGSGLTSAQWQNGRRGRDGWGKYTRRRKWCRGAQLVEVLHEEIAQEENVAPGKSHGEESLKTPTRKSTDAASGDAKEDDESVGSTRKRRAWFTRRSSQPNSERSAAPSSASVRSAVQDEDEDIHLPLSVKQADRSATWGMADDPDMLFG
jgi:hypothetical protein